MNNKKKQATSTGANDKLGEKSSMKESLAYEQCARLEKDAEGPQWWAYHILGEPMVPPEVDTDLSTGLATHQFLCNNPTCTW